MGPTENIGFDNYRKAFSDPIFLKAIRNSVKYALIVVPIQSAMGLYLALLVNSKIKGSKFFRSAFYFPSIASSAAITTLFIFLMAPDGVFNGVLRFLVWIRPIFLIKALGFQILELRFIRSLA